GNVHTKIRILLTERCVLEHFQSRLPTNSLNNTTAKRSNQNSCSKHEPITDFSIRKSRWQILATTEMSHIRTANPPYCDIGSNCKQNKSARTEDNLTGENSKVYIFEIQCIHPYVIRKPAEPCECY